MLNFTIRLFQRKQQLAVLFFSLLAGLIPKNALSQEITPAFKISGPKSMEVYPRVINQRLVEYDPASADHLFISYTGEKGVLLEITQFLFKGKKFNLSDFQNYINRKELLKDGIHTTFSEDQSIAIEMIYKNDTLRQQTRYYTNGAKHITFSGDENTLNGEFIMWYPNGKISFLGNYKNNLKDGSFESFDEAGNLSRKGTYQEGKLISGESVVQDFVYDTPEVPAQCKDGEEAFNEYLRVKTADLAAVKEMKEGIIKDFNLLLTIDKIGHINKMEITSYLNPTDIDMINAVFKEFPGFKPALIEGVPVRSILKQSLILTNKGLQTEIQLETQSADALYLIVEEMPEFPTGDMGLREYIALTVNYPVEAQEGGIQGKVYVKFVIQEDGSIADIAIVRNVHPLLDAEAIRVVQQMPKWKPGRQDGKPVKVIFTVPINFVLQ